LSNSYDLIIRTEDVEHRLRIDSGQSVRDILDTTEQRVRSGCMGIGACGLCRILVIEGDAGPATKSERAHLTSEELADGVRLACQVRPRGSTRIEVLSPAPSSNWQSIPASRGGYRESEVAPPLREPPAGIVNPYGVAVDVGTTYISVALSELSSGKRLAGRYGVNPQVEYGSDVVTRLTTASRSPELARTMGLQVVEAIGEALFDIALREGVNLDQVARLIIVGNTAMLTLSTTVRYELLLKPEFWAAPIECSPENVDSWVDCWGINERAEVEIVSPFAGFIGSDLLAGVLATRLIDGKQCELFLDFGTNTEIALWNGSTLYLASAAGGPAFEGSGISCGLPAETGAIKGVSSQEGTDVFELDVISGVTARGLCGSGLVDLIACLVRNRRLFPDGNFAEYVSADGFVILEGKHSITLTKHDVDLIQRAKAAVAGGVQVLLDKAGVRISELKRICVGGVFGRNLDVVNAQLIGLLPVVSPAVFELPGNTALAGCEDILLSDTARKRLDKVRKKARIIDLSRSPGFEDLFLENLYLEPMRARK